MKRVLFSFMMMIAILISSFQPVSATVQKKNGFEVDDSVYNVQWTKRKSVDVKSEYNDGLGSLIFTLGLCRFKNSNDYTLLVRMEMDPCKRPALIQRDNTGSHYGYGYSKYASVTIPSLIERNEHYPINEPHQEEETITLGATKNGPSISFSVKRSKNNLDILNRTTGTTYSTEYKYTAFTSGSASKNAYLANLSEHKGYVMFESSSPTVVIDINGVARFGAAETPDAAPGRIFGGYIREAKLDHWRCEFTVPKNNEKQPTNKAKEFVKRYYAKCLKRTPDSDGVVYWATQLVNGYKSAAEITAYFFESEEFIKKQLGDEEFVVRLYNTCMGRDADLGGLAYWVSKLKTHKTTRHQVIRDFVYSTEFEKICEEYGFKRGTLK